MLAVFIELLWPRQHGGVARHIELRGIYRAPVRVGIAGLRALRGVEGRLAIAIAAPVDRQRRVTAPHQELHLAERSALSTAVDVHDGWHFLLGFCRKAIDRRHARRFALEAADEVAHLAKHRAIFLPFTDHLCLQRVLARIKVRPQLCYGSGTLCRLEAQGRGE